MNRSPVSGQGLYRRGETRDPQICASCLTVPYLVPRSTPQLRCAPKRESGARLDPGCQSVCRRSTCRRCACHRLCSDNRHHCHDSGTVLIGHSWLYMNKCRIWKPSAMTGLPPVPRPAGSDVSRRRTKKACMACQRKKLKVCDAQYLSQKGSSNASIPSFTTSQTCLEDAEGWVAN